MTEPGHRPIIDQLRDTLAFAVEQVPWYSERSQDYAVAIEEYADLARLPIIDRDTVLADPLAFTSGDVHPTSTSYTSSTTRGIGMPRWRSAAEGEALNRLLGARGPTGTDAGDPGITLVIHPFDQGAPDPAATRADFAFVAMYVPWHYELIHQALRDGWSTPGGRRRISAVECFSPGLRILTTWFEQRGIDPGAFGVEKLYGYGSIQSEPWRRRLRESWQAAYEDIYGMSEVLLSGAHECPLCSAYHYDVPIIPEVVHPSTRAQIDRGTGIMVFTELYPYSQLQLFVRYWSDDLVELAPPCPLGGFGVFFRGRRSASVVLDTDGDGSLVVGALQVGEICASLPDTALAPIEWAGWAPDVGAPQFHLGSSGREIVVRVALRYPPALFPEAADRVRTHIEAALIAQVTGLGAAIGDGAAGLRVETVAVDALSETTKV